jgi:tetratricopeptide (TPR) repeat protein
MLEEKKGDEISLAKVHYDKGLELYKAKKNEEALQEFDKAIELDPSYVEAYIEAGNACYDIARSNINARHSSLYYSTNTTGIKFHQKAFGYYNKAIELDPSNAYAQYIQGINLHNLGCAEIDENEYGTACGRLDYYQGEKIRDSGYRHKAQAVHYRKKAADLNPDRYPYNDNDCCIILVCHDVEYDNPILNYPVILTSLSSQLNLTQSEVIDRISGYDREFVDQVCLSGNIELFGDLS